MLTGKRIRIWREHLGLSQSGLARDLGWHRQQLHALETGTMSPKVSTLEKLVDGMGLTMGRFWTETPTDADTVIVLDT